MHDTDPRHHDSPDAEIPLAPETVSHALTLLRSLGYEDDFDLAADGLTCSTNPTTLDPADAVVDHTFRFEGATDPSDEAIVLGISAPRHHRKGVLVSAFGPTADAEHARVLRALVDRSCA